MPHPGWRHTPESIAKIRASWTPARKATHARLHTGAVRPRITQERIRVGKSRYEARRREVLDDTVEPRP
jgi:hypothetical protein